jgi:hypothetical protein
MQRPGADCGQKQDLGGGMHRRKKLLGEQEGRKKQEGRK